jgi:hypothetical protein
MCMLKHNLAKVGVEDSNPFLSANVQHESRTESLFYRFSLTICESAGAKNKSRDRRD